MFIPYTPKGMLRKKLQKLKDEALASTHAGRVRMVERGGTTLISQLSDKSSWLSEHCGRIDIRGKETKNALVKHWMNDHKGEWPPRFD